MALNIIDQSFVRLRKNVSSIHIWKVEKTRIIPVTKENYGKLHSEDVYLLFSVSEFGRINHIEDKIYTITGKSEIHIHFWLGSEYVQEEAVTGSLKAVELDAFINASSILHRECYGNESNRFLSYFRNGIRYLKGRMKLHSYQDEIPFHHKFYHVFGTRKYVAEEITNVTWDCMIGDQVYVLHVQDFIFVWVGRYSSDIEKILGAKLAADLVREKKGGNVVIIEDGQETKMEEVERQHFEKYLPLNLKQLNNSFDMASNIVEISKSEVKQATDMKLYECIEDEGSIKISELKSAPFFHSDLCSNRTFLIDCGHQGIWMWIGRNISYTDRSEAIRNAQGFITKKGLPAVAPIARAIEGSEPLEFRTLFLHWKDSEAIGYKSRFIAAKNTAMTAQKKYDAYFLLQNPIFAAYSQMVDDGLSEKEIWRVSNFNLEKVPQDCHGEFFMNDCYVILYAYESNKSNFILYYWIGSKSTIEDRQTASRKVLELNARLDDKAIVARINQGKEPPHFIAIFDGHMIVYKECKTEEDCVKSVYMMQVHGSTFHSTRAYEVDLLANSLKSNHCFILSTPCQTFVWSGKRSTGDEREVAKKLAKSRGDVVLISEGNEPEEFCQIFGSLLYNCSQKPKSDKCKHDARLFHCSLGQNGLMVEEILDFAQNDLAEDSLMILDTWDIIYVWIGKFTNYSEQENAEMIADEYLRKDPAHRYQDLPVYKINQENEPPTFKGFFIQWDLSLFNYSQNSNVCTKIEENCPGAKLYLTPTGQSSTGHWPVRTFPMSTLFVNDPSSLPDTVNPEFKEQYLCDADFQKLFSMDKETYRKLSQWKKTVLKKKVGLF